MGMVLSRQRVERLMGWCVVAACCVACSDSSPPRATDSQSQAAVQLPASTLQARVEQLVAQSRSPGAIAAVVVRGGTPTVVASGEDPHTHTALAPGDPFRIASITKTFVGALALRLVQQQRLSLDDTVSHYLPDWPQGSQITVRMLLTHTSGLAPFGDDTGSPGPYSEAAQKFSLDHYGKNVSPDEVLAFVHDRPLLFSPGTDTSYSNINTILLGKIVTSITGHTLGADLHRELLDPLGLTSSRYAPEEPTSPIAGVSDLAGNGSVLDTGPVDWTADNSIQGAAGGMVSTIGDLLRWGDALLRTRTVVGDPLASDAFHIQSGGTGLGVLGYSTTGFYCVFDPNGCPTGTVFSGIGGSGATSGARSVLVYDPRTDSIVAAMVNRDGTPGLEEFVRDVLDMVTRIENGQRPNSSS